MYAINPLVGSLNSATKKLPFGHYTCRIVGLGNCGTAGRGSFVVARLLEHFATFNSNIEIV